MRQPTRPGEGEPDPAQGGESTPPAAPEPLWRLDGLPPLGQLRTNFDRLSREWRSHLDEASTELNSEVGRLRSGLSQLSSDLRSRQDGMDPDEPGRRRLWFELNWGSETPGGPRRLRYIVQMGLRRPRRPVWPGWRIAATALTLAIAIIGAAAASIIGIGLPLLDVLLRRTRTLADRQRGRMPGTPIPSPYRPLPPRLATRLTTMLRDKTTWRDLAWLISFGIIGTVHAVVLLLGWIVAIAWLLTPAIIAFTDLQVFFLDTVVKDQPTAWKLAALGLLLTMVLYPFRRAFPKIETWISRALLTPPLSHRIDQLTATRADAVDMQAAELARIERDLHDGAQARLVALALNLGLAEQLITRDPEAAQNLVAEARTAAGTALGELRDVIRGILPPLLADRGLAGGLEALALASPVPVYLTIDLPRRPPPALESALYFTVAELLTNAIRHARATRIRLAVHIGRQTLEVHLEDNGCGGARPRAGSGLMGLQRRLAAFDGRLTIDSPPGGGTRVEVTVPCVP